MMRWPLSRPGAQGHPSLGCPREQGRTPRAPASQHHREQGAEPPPLLSETADLVEHKASGTPPREWEVWCVSE